MVNWTEKEKLAVHIFLEKIWKRSVNLLYPLSSVATKWTGPACYYRERNEILFLFTPGTPCQLLNMLFNSARHSMRYYYPYFCRWGNWSAVLWSNLFKIALLLSGRSKILTWVWLTLKSLCHHFLNCFHKVKKSIRMLVILFLNIFVIILNHIVMIKK